MEKGFTVWFTGLPYSGKSTLSKLLENALRKRGGDRIEVLDEDELGFYLTKGPGSTKEDRDGGIRRIGFMCKLLTRNGVVALSAAMSPCRETRNFIRGEIGRFVEVYCKCPREVCIERTAKGPGGEALTGQAGAGTAGGDPYEEPLQPEVTVETAKETPEACVGTVIAGLVRLGYLEEAESVYTEEEEEKIRKRLEGWGYL